jgi:Ras-related protein Rab-7A
MGERSCKVVFLGDVKVGKTALFIRLTEGSFTEDIAATIGADFGVCSWTYNSRPLSFQIWDTAGQERFNAIGPAFFRGTDACVFVFDLRQRETLDHVLRWRELFTQVIDSQTPRALPCLLLGNKADLADERAVSNEAARQFGEEHGFTFFEVSAKTGLNMREVMDEMARAYFESIRTEVVRLAPLAGVQEAEAGWGAKCCAA